MQQPRKLAISRRAWGNLPLSTNLLLSYSVLVTAILFRFLSSKYRTSHQEQLFPWANMQKEPTLDSPI